LRRNGSEGKQRKRLQKKKMKKLRDFIARKIECLIEEQKDMSKQQREREVAIEVEITREGLKDLSMQERKLPTLELLREEVLPLHPLDEHQQ
jgi:hypothetical protein